MTAVKSAIVAIVNALEREALVLKRFEWDRGYPSEWCFPGGRVEGVESSVDAARRETLEETGLLVDSLEYFATRNSRSKSGREYEIDCFLTTSYAGDLVEYPSEEHERAAWIPIPELGLLHPVGRTTSFLANVVTHRYG